jgi:hypothetical protein
MLATRVSRSRRWALLAGGDVGTQTTVHNQYPSVNAYDTEHSGGAWIGNQQDEDMRNLIDYTRNWGRGHRQRYDSPAQHLQRHGRAAVERHRRRGVAQPGIRPVPRRHRARFGRRYPLQIWDCTGGANQKWTLG